jgi:hypothetical protein
VITKDDSVKGLMRRLQAQRQSWDDWPKHILDTAEWMRKEPGMSEEARDVVALGAKYLERGLANLNSDKPHEVRKAARFMMVVAFFIGSRTLGYDPRRGIGGKKGAAHRLLVKTAWQTHVRARVAAIWANDPNMRGNRKGAAITKKLLDEGPQPGVRLPGGQDVYEFVLAELKALK